MSKQKWLITGGAGYIGTHIADLFIEAGKDVVLLDSLYQGLKPRVDYLSKKHGREIPLHVIDIRDYTAVENILKSQPFTGIVHTAALKAVGESVEKPDEYNEVNYTATTKLLVLAQKYGVKKFLFSSTAAVYGSPDTMEPCKENGPLAPISPYGSTKLDAESKVTEFINTPGNSGTSLRFFNVVGTASQELLDNSVENLVPIVLGKLNNGEAPVIFGIDYPTIDGTCVRDYVHVNEICDSLKQAIEKPSNSIECLGHGVGYTVKEIVDEFQKVNDVSFNVKYGPRRKGDIASSVLKNVSPYMRNLYTMDQLLKV